MMLSASHAGTAWAQAADKAGDKAGDKAVAEALFVQGRKLMAEGKYPEACAKLAESNRLDEGLGTMLYLADCYEKNGQSASAWGQFKEAAALAASRGDKRDKVARERAARLEPTLSRVLVTAPTDLAGLEVRRDGEIVAPATWNSEIPIDPGKHLFAASAPGHKPWQTEVTVAKGGGVVRIAVPTLEAEASAPLAAVTTPAEPSPPPVADVDTSRGNGQRVWAYVAGGVGVAALGTSLGLALAAKSKHDAAKKDHCGGGDTCDPTGLEERDQAVKQAQVATAVAIVGGVLVATGVTLFVLAPKKSEARTAVLPYVGPGAGGVELVGRF